MTGSSVTLIWNFASGAGAYSVGLRDQNTGSLVFIPLVTGTSYTASVTQGHSYAWDVASCISSGGGDNTSNCPNRSFNWSFAVQSPAPPAPTLSSPSNGATVTGSSVTLIWNFVSGAGAYSVGLRDQNTGSLVFIPLVTGTSYTASVTQGHSYAWDVASCISSGGGDNTSNCPNRSFNWSFAVQSPAPPAPTLSSPADGATVTGTSVTLIWNAASGAGAYSVGLRDLTTNTLSNIPLLTGTSTTQTVIQGHSYRWDVASCISTGGGDNTSNCPNRSGNRTFAVQGAAPPAPVLSSPADGATVAGPSVTLVWNAASGAAAYSVGLRDLTTNTLANIPLLTGTSTTQTVIQGHSYRWDVASCISSGGSDNTSNCPNRSGNRTFSVQGVAPPAPTLVSPADGATISITSVTLQWNAVSGAAAYSVGLRDLTTNQLYSIALITGTSTTQSVTAGHSYRWDVASCISYGGGDNTTNCPNRSGNRTFSVQSVAPPAPSLVSPVDGAKISGTSVTLQWNAVGGAAAYSVGLRDLTTNQLYSIALITGTSTTQSVTAGHSYRWDVASCISSSGGDNTTNCANRSGNRTFSVQSVVTLAVNGFQTSYTTTTVPYTPPISLTGSGFNSVTKITWSCKEPTGNACAGSPYIWTAINWSGKFIVSSDSAAVVKPTLVAAGDPIGTYQWAVIFYAGSQSVKITFSVTYSPNKPILVVTPTTSPVNDLAGSTSFSVSNGGAGALTYSATITSGGSWLSFQSGQTGGSSGTITVRYAKNNGTPRVGSIQVSAKDVSGNPVSGSPTTVTVMQDSRKDTSPLSGKGDWIWHIPASINAVGGSTVQALVNYEKSHDVKYLIVKAGEGQHLWPNSQAGRKQVKDLIQAAHFAGLKVFGFLYVYGGAIASGGTEGSLGNPPDAKNCNKNTAWCDDSDPANEGAIAVQILDLGVDGLVIDAEDNYFDGNPLRIRNDGAQPPKAAVAARTYFHTIRTANNGKYKKAFLAYAPYPIPTSPYPAKGGEKAPYNSPFPYLTFSLNTQAVLPQAYYRLHPNDPDPTKMVQWMNDGWQIVYADWAARKKFGAIKPIFPVGWGNGKPACGNTAKPGDFLTFVAKLNSISPPASPGGYTGVSLWDAECHSAGIWSELSSASIGGAPLRNARPAGR